MNLQCSLYKIFWEDFWEYWAWHHGQVFVSVFFIWWLCLHSQRNGFTWWDKNLNMTQFKSYVLPNQTYSAGINRTLHLYPAQVKKRKKKGSSTCTRGFGWRFRKLGQVNAEIPQTWYKARFSISQNKFTCSCSNLWQPIGACLLTVSWGGNYKILSLAIPCHSTLSLSMS